jgi:hypothetical protein
MHSAVAYSIVSVIACSCASAAPFPLPAGRHFYTDEAIPDFDPDAAQQTWERILHFLNDIAQA